MIKIEHLSKVYGDVTVLKDINAEIRKGEVVSIIGPSGTGKSTLLRCLNLLEHPTSGSITVDGINLLDPATDVPAIRQRMNMVFQSFNLFAHLSALENLTLAPIKLRGMAPKDAEEKGMELLRLVGLGEKAHHFPDELSGGQKQRVAIARCLAMDPEILLFDEPTSALDPTMISEVLAVIRRLAGEGMTMAIVTHEMDFARDVSNRIFYMDEGLIYEEGPPAQIFDNPQREKTRAFIQRIRSYRCSVNSPDFDLYAIHGGIDTFCEKHVIPRQARHDLQLLAEELLQLARPSLQGSGTASLSIDYSEATGAIAVQASLEPTLGNPLEGSDEGDELSRTLVRNLLTNSAYSVDDGRGLLRLTMRGS
ncbi:MAG: amino acid ABC transporter ATP-binding protein [Steroidobacteraceae bacterium]